MLRIKKDNFEVVIASIICFLISLLNLIIFKLFSEVTGYIVVCMECAFISIIFKTVYRNYRCMTAVFIILLLMADFLWDVFSVYLKANISFSARMLPNILILVFAISEYRSFIKVNRKLDMLILLYLIVCVLEFVVGILNPNSSIGDSAYVLMYMFRAVPLYFILKNHKIELEVYYKWYYVICVLLILVESMLGMHVDSRNGFWGIYNSASCWIFLCIRMGFLVAGYLENKYGLFRSLLEASFLMFLAIITEQKAVLGIIVITTMLIIVFSKRGVMKRITLFLVSFPAAGVALYIMSSMYSFRFGSGIYSISKMINYLFGNSNWGVYRYGRFEAGIRIYNEMCMDAASKLFGCGFGSAFPCEDLFYAIRAGSGHHMFYLLERYGARYGYTLSGFSCLLIEGGIVGIIILILPIAMQFYLFMKLIGKQELNKGYTYAMLFVAVLNIFYFVYGNAFMFFDALALTFVLMGICANRIEGSD